MHPTGRRVHVGTGRVAEGREGVKSRQRFTPPMGSCLGAGSCSGAFIIRDGVYVKTASNYALQ